MDRSDISVFRNHTYGEHTIEKWIYNVTGQRIPQSVLFLYELHDLIQSIFGRINHSVFTP